MACAKANKYTTCALLGFGSFNVATGRGLLGKELQNSLRQNAKDPKRRLWGLEIRTPMTNRLINGIALASRGAEDGLVGRKYSIPLND